MRPRLAESEPASTSAERGGSTEPPAELRWFVVQSAPRKERFVRDRLSALGREVFLPMIAERRRGRRVVTVAPLFPGYLFASLSAPGGDFPRVRWMHGVRRILGGGSRPHEVPGEVVELIRSRSDASGLIRRRVRLRRGDRVRIVRGPLAGLIGVLEGPASSAEERVCVLLDLFERETRVEVPEETIGLLAVS